MSTLSISLTKLTLLLLIILVEANLQAQERWGSYYKIITEQGYAGHKFRYTAFVRTDKEDADASAQLWIRVDRNGKRGYSNNLLDIPKQTAE